MLAMLAACDQEIVPPEAVDDFAAEAFSVPARMNVANPQAYDFSYRVTHPNGVSAIAEVTLQFFASDQSTILEELALYDDGGVLFPGDKDVVANDGIFSNSSVVVLPEGDIYLQAEATDSDGQIIRSEFVMAISLANLPPVLQTIDAPDTLQSGSQAQAFTAAVLDSNDILDVTAVLMRLMQRGNLIATDSLPLVNTISQNEGEFARQFDSTYAAERRGEYELEFQAIDFNEDLSNILSKTIFLENLASTLRNPMVPDTVRRPAAGADSLLIQISVNDPQGLGDIESVRFTVERDGGTPAILDMVDNGELGDDVPNDGIYSRGIVVDENSALGIFSFTFEAADRVGNTAPTVVDTLVITR